MLGFDLSPGSLLTRRRQTGSLPAVTLRGVYDGGAQGLYVDASQPDGLFSDLYGLEPVTQQGDRIMMALDQSAGLREGPELFDQAALENGMQGWVVKGTGTAEVINGALRLERPGSEDLLAYCHFTAEPGRLYRVRATIDVEAGGSAHFLLSRSYQGNDLQTGTIEVLCLAQLSLVRLTMRPASGPGAIRVSNISIKPVEGRHLYQKTTARQPIWDVDAQGRGCINFDGVDDQLETTLPSPLSGDFSATVLADIDVEATADWGAVCSQSPGTAGAGFAMTMKDRRPALDLWGSRLRAAALPAGRQVVGTVKATGALEASGSLSLNGEPLAASLEGADVPVPDLAAGTLRIGALDAAIPLPFRLYGLAFYDQALDAAMVATLSSQISGGTS